MPRKSSREYPHIWGGVFTDLEQHDRFYAEKALRRAIKRARVTLVCVIAGLLGAIFFL